MNLEPCSIASSIINIPPATYNLPDNDVSKEIMRIIRSYPDIGKLLQDNNVNYPVLVINKTITGSYSLYVIYWKNGNYRAELLRKTEITLPMLTALVTHHDKTIVTKILCHVLESCEELMRSNAIPLCDSGYRLWSLDKELNVVNVMINLRKGILPCWHDDVYRHISEHAGQIAVDQMFPDKYFRAQAEKPGEDNTHSDTTTNTDANVSESDMTNQHITDQLNQYHIALSNNRTRVKMGFVEDSKKLPWVYNNPGTGNEVFVGMTAAPLFSLRVNKSPRGFDLFMKMNWFGGSVKWEKIRYQDVTLTMIDHIHLTHPELAIRYAEWLSVKLQSQPMSKVSRWSSANDPLLVKITSSSMDTAISKYYKFMLEHPLPIELNGGSVSAPEWFAIHDYQVTVFNMCGGLLYKSLCHDLLPHHQVENPSSVTSTTDATPPSNDSDKVITPGDSALNTCISAYAPTDVVSIPFDVYVSLMKPIILAKIKMGYRLKDQEIELVEALFKLGK